MDVEQRVLRGEEVLVTAQVLVACVGGGRARRIPDGLRRRLEGGTDGA
jgi:acyl-CoA thioester hydrolase